MKVIFLLIGLSSAAFSQGTIALETSNIIWETISDTVNKIITYDTSIDSSAIVCDTITCRHKQDTTINVNTAYDIQYYYKFYFRFDLFDTINEPYRVVIDSLGYLGGAPDFRSRLFAIDSIQGDTIRPGNSRLVTFYSTMAGYPNKWAITRYHATNLITGFTIWDIPNATSAIRYPHSSKQAFDMPIFSANGRSIRIYRKQNKIQMFLSKNAAEIK